MLSLIVSGLSKVGMWAAVVEGANVVVAGAKRIAPERAAPVVSGIGDTITTLLDPLDFTGTRARKEKAEQDKLAAAYGDAKKQKAAAAAAKKKAAKAKKVADKKIAQLQAKLKKAAKEEAALEKKAARLAAEGKKAEAQRIKDKAAANRKYAQIAQRAAAESDKAKSEDNAEASAKFASQALELAKLAIAPPSNAIDAIVSESTDAGKALIASLVDAVNSERELDADRVFMQLNQNDVSTAYVDEAWLDGELDGYVEGVDWDAEGDGIVAGSCCMSCARGAGSCDGLKPVPDSLVAGSFGDGIIDSDDPADDFIRYFNSNDELEQAMVSGPDIVTFLQGHQEWETALERQHGSCVDGRCLIPAEY